MNDDPKLRELLRDSLPDTPVPSRFAADVWACIEARDRIARRGWTRLFEPLLSWLARPDFAALALLLAAGGAAGAASLHAANVNERARTTLAERHVATLDPYARIVAMR